MQHNMGQAHPKATAVGLEVSPSTGPDPTIFRPQHITHSSLPPLPDPPHSAPMVIQRTDETYSRLDYTPTGLPKPSSGRTLGKSRNLARKLSLKAKESLGTDGRGSVGEKMKLFEGMVQAAEARKGLDVSTDNGGRTKDSASTSKPNYPFMEDDLIRYQPPFSALITATPIPFPSEPITPGHPGRPTHHRRSSSNSVKSGKASIKSSKRAEREWRARVAALAHPPPPQPSSKKSRGPLPPRRTPAARRPDISITSTDSPASDALVTPPHGSGTAAKSFISNRSFETLGHYANLSPTFGRDTLVTDVERERKVSVPHSVVSSFYFDPVGGSRVSTRPSSFAASHLLGTIPADHASPLRHFTVVPDDLGTDEEDDEIGDMATPTEERIRKASLPPFESFRLSPVTVTSPMIMPASLPGTTTKARKVYQTKRASAPPERVGNLSPLLPLPNVELQVNITKDAESRYHASPPGNGRRARNSAPPLSSSADMAPSSAQTARNESSSIEAPPLPMMPIATPLQARTAKATVPGTPLSPTTAFLMTAPIDSIDVTKFMCAPSNTASPEQSRIAHPYSTVPVAIDSPRPPTPPMKIARPSLAQGEYPQPDQPASATVASLEAAMTSFDPFTAPHKAKSIKKPPPRHDVRPSVLQPCKTQPRAMALGSGVDSARADLERQREKLKRMGVDLTPGMEDGNRPPKSGLPKVDLERWLIATAR